MGNVERRFLQQLDFKRGTREYSRESTMSSNEVPFTKVVRRKGRRGIVSKSVHPTCRQLVKEEPKKNVLIESHCLQCGKEYRSYKESILRRMKQTISQLKESDFYDYFYELICKSLERLKKSSGTSALPCPVKIICYGIGNFSECLTAQYQLGLIMILQEALAIPLELFDPVLITIEKEILSQVYNFQLIPNNEEGKRDVDELTIFYLPHLPNQLINNLLFANWSVNKLTNCILVSNSFQNIKEAVPTKEYSFIVRAEKIGEEFELENDFRYKDIFNDTAVHFFPKDKLDLVDANVWLDKEPPLYSKVDFVSAKAN